MDRPSDVEEMIAAVLDYAKNIGRSMLIDLLDAPTAEEPNS